MISEQITFAEKSGLFENQKQAHSIIYNSPFPFNPQTRLFTLSFPGFTDKGNVTALVLLF